METTVRNAVVQAILATEPEYLMHTMGLHAPSWGEDAAHTMAWALRADWKPYLHPDIVAPAEGYYTTRAGNLLIVPLAMHDDEDEIVFDEPSPKSSASGFVMGTSRKVVLGEETDIAIALIGPHEGGNVLYTLHAGAPIRPSTVPAEWAGKRVSVGFARTQLGVTHVRVRTL